MYMDCLFMEHTDLFFRTLDMVASLFPGEFYDYNITCVHVCYLHFRANNFLFLNLTTNNNSNDIKVLTVDYYYVYWLPLSQTLYLYFILQF